MKGFAQLGIVFFTVLTLGVAPYATAGTLTYTYDEAGRLTRVEYDNGYVTTYTYDEAGNLLKQKTQKRRRSRGSSSAEESKTEPEVEGETVETPLD